MRVFARLSSAGRTPSVPASQRGTRPPVGNGGRKGVESTCAKVAGGLRPDADAATQIQQPGTCTVLSRRHFLRQAGGGLGALALCWMLEQEAAAGRSWHRRAAIHPAGPLSGEGRASSTCSCTAARATSRHSTPSPISSGWPASRCPAASAPVATRRKVAHNPLLATQPDVSQVRPERHRDLRLLASSRRVRRRPGGDPLVLGRQRQPSAGRLRDEHRLDPDGQAEPGELGQLRPGDREPGPARRSSFCPTRPAGSRAARRPMARASCRPAIREP